MGGKGSSKLNLPHFSGQVSTAAFWVFWISRFRRPASRALSPLPPLHKLEKRKRGEPRVFPAAAQQSPDQGHEAPGRVPDSIHPGSLLLPTHDGPDEHEACVYAPRGGSL